MENIFKLLVSRVGKNCVNNMWTCMVGIKTPCEGQLLSKTGMKWLKLQQGKMDWGLKPDLLMTKEPWIGNEGLSQSSPKVQARGGISPVKERRLLVIL